jgi:threonyl-tRNA synthetase
MEDCVTAFVSVETEDETDLDAVVANAADELREVTDQLNTRKVVLYPDAHLSDDLADPDSAKTALRDLETALEGEYEVMRAPLGWYTSYEVACKGHPLSELSRHVTAERAEDGTADDAEPAPSDWKLAFPEAGTADLSRTETIESLDAEVADRVNDDMRALVADEVDGETASAGEEPTYVELLREQELVGDDELGDAGTLRWYPRGKLVRDSLTEYATDLAVEYGASSVETPATYDLGVRAVREHAERFGESRSRSEPGDRPVTLRSTACIGHFSLMRDADLSKSDLPLRLYELSTPSSQRERRGEVARLGRPGAFTTPEMHTAARDAERARAELRAQAKLGLQTGDDLGLNYEPTIRLTREFYDDNEAWVESLVEDLGKPALLEVLPERRHCWSVTVAFAAIGGRGHPIETATVRLDVESAERFDVEYDTSEETRHPPIVHCWPTGGIERAVAALLETAAKRETPRLPTWLSPVQVRFVPVADEHVDYCDALAADLASAGIRADVDERNETVGERIASAETDGVPYYAVVGDRETESGDGADDETLAVTVRGEDEERELTFDEVTSAVLADVGDLPKKRRNHPKHRSDRPNFAGR